MSIDVSAPWPPRPWQNIDLAVPELEQAAGELGMQGCDGHPLGMIPC
jgi:hypothetical protein